MAHLLVTSVNNKVAIKFRQIDQNYSHETSVLIQITIFSLNNESCNVKFF